MLGGREVVLEAALGRSDAGPTRCYAYTGAHDAGRRSVIGAVSLREPAGILMCMTNRFNRCGRYHLRLEIEGIGSSRRLAAALQRLCLRCHCCADVSNEIAIVRRDG